MSINSNKDFFALMIKGKQQPNYIKQLMGYEEFVEVKEPTSEKRFLRFLELFAAQKAACCKQ